MFQRVAAGLAVLFALVAAMVMIQPVTADAATTAREAPYRTWIQFKDFHVKTVKVAREGGFIYVWVKTCVRAERDGSEAKVRVSLDPWSIYTDRWLRPRAFGESGGYKQPLFPRESWVAPGDCRAGFLEFWAEGSRAPIDSVHYRNSVGNRAVMIKGYQGRRELWHGEWAEFERHAVKVTSVERDGSFVYARIRHCVKDAPGLPTEPMRIGIDQWSLITGSGRIDPRAGGESGGYRQPLFPHSTQVQPGRCRSGYLEFWKPSGGTGVAEFHRPVADTADWSRPH